MEVHIVVKGDTLWKIARQYNIPFEELKRVNAHLANPDYIVPGMKIFLPMDKKKPIRKGEQSKREVRPHEKPHHGPSEKPYHKPTEKPHHKPSEKPVIPPQSHTKPSKPTPPKPQPPAQQVPPLPQTPQMPMQPPKPPQMPHMPQQPPATQLPHMPAVPMWQAVFPICGWMPIFDADCHPHMSQQPMPPAMQAPIKPLPSKESSKWYEESSHHHHRPAPIPMPDGWQLIESSSLHTSTRPTPMPAPTPPVAMPEQSAPKPMPMPMVPPAQPSIPPKACTPATWCPSNQDYQDPCSPQWPGQQQPQWPMHSMPPMQPFQWLPVCPPAAPMMQPWPQPMNPMPWPQNMPNYPTPNQDDWPRNP
ncbi:LysM domain-containing protein [Sporosarcina sp. GW1-11]|uniref:LysM peptidoglycan-binding domain-containing protein n=1 Tax=Sporosarcina sp. GW1-11 TaxID=2899126 RepID=UPI00294D1A60|nr:LysM domain-containing protein [Sporosarcina sp. GW1-11]MDV6377206.1 LysM domain-containing protein [Sporosarcina sp. GW1-11]